MATLPRASDELVCFETRPRVWRLSTKRVVRLADRPVAFARSAILNWRFGDSERCMIVVYSLAVRPTPRIRSPSRSRGSTLRIRISARQSASSFTESGSTAGISKILTCFAKQRMRLGTPLRPDHSGSIHSRHLESTVSNLSEDMPPADRIAVVVGGSRELGRGAPRGQPRFADSAS